METKTVPSELITEEQSMAGSNGQLSHMRNEEHSLKRDEQWFPNVHVNSPVDMNAYSDNDSVDSRQRYRDISKFLNQADDNMVYSKPMKRTSSRKNNSYGHHNHRGYMDHHHYHSSQRIRHKKEPKRNCVSYLTGILHCYNVFLLILGAGVLAVGVWLLVKDYNSREISAVIGSRLFEYVTYGLTAGGGTVAILAFCGCCGTMRQDKFVLGFYGTILTVVFMLLCAGFGLGITFRKELKEDLTEHFKQSLMKHYRVDIDRNSHNKLITDAWDAMQRTLECCGAVGDEDDYFSWAIYKLHSDWYSEVMKGMANRPYVPESCCVQGKSIRHCQGLSKDAKGLPVKGPPLTYITDRNDALLKKGCYDRAIDYITNHSLYITIVAGTVPILLIVGMIISFYLCAIVKGGDDDDYDEDEEVEV